MRTIHEFVPDLLLFALRMDFLELIDMEQRAPGIRVRQVAWCANDSYLVVSGH